MKIALIGHGEVGRILAEDLAAHDLTIYDILPERTVAASAADAVREADLILCAVTAAEDLKAAQSIAPHIANGALYVDLNSVSPGQKQASAEVIEAAGGRYVEAAVMTPFPPRRIASSMLVGGPHAKAFADLAAPLGFTGARVFSDVIGKASATKMCRSVMIKGIEALCGESLLAARHYGVEQDVLNSLSDLLPIGDWEQLAHYMIGRTLEHGKRRAEEMEEAARTVAEAGVEPLMTTATVARQAWSAHRRDAFNDDLGLMLDAVRSHKT